MRTNLSEHVGIRLDDAELARIDALVARSSRPWQRVTRSQILRALLAAALEEAENTCGDAPPIGGRNEPSRG